MQIMENIKPAGWEGWAARAKEKVEKHPETFKPGKSSLVYGEAGGQAFVEIESHEEDDDNREWDGEQNIATLEGTRASEEGRLNARMAMPRRPGQGDPVEWEPEPPLDASQCVLQRLTSQDV